MTRVPDTLYFASTVSHEAAARTGEGQDIVKPRLAAAASTAKLLLGALGALSYINRLQRRKGDDPTD
ncbi:MAG: hypothetical protein IMY84_05650 [Chloroflexi bacterium]|nr:hypothetical protein [Chloroflexota bacterium]